MEPKTWRELFDAVYEMNSATNHADFAASVVAGMSRLIESDVVHFQVLDRASGRILTRMRPPDVSTPEEIAYYTAHSGEHPLVAYYARTGDTAARRVSDVVGLREWLDGDYYRHCLQRLNLPYSVGLPVTVDASIVVGLSFSRRKEDFSLHDCELLDAFGPHLRLAWKRHDSPWADHRQLAAQRSFQNLHLTARESEILYWITEGKQNSEIAVILGVQLGTVQEHVENIARKLSCENRHQVTVLALSKLRER